MYFLKINEVGKVVDCIVNAPPNLQDGVYVESLPTCPVEADEIAMVHYNFDTEEIYFIKEKRK